MNRVPVAFAFDHNLSFPACVCLSSLMMHANENTFYDIFILHSQNENIGKQELNKIAEYYKNCKIHYRVVDNVFEHAFEIRGITTPAYYRLLIPEVIPEYDKIIYSDVDVIFRMDLSELYSMDISNYYLAATRDLGINLSSDGKKYIEQTDGLSHGEYLQSGFIMLNSELMRKDGLVCKFKARAKKRYKFQDQDILNIVCGGRVLFLPLLYNMTDYSYFYLHRNKKELMQWYTLQELFDAEYTGNIHYNGHKPWKKYAVNFDIWWEHYRKSPYFNSDYYFEFFYNKLNELDQLPFTKRVKILLRYFIYGVR